MSELPPLPSKPEVARALLLKGSVFLHLDPRRSDVMVPPWLRMQPQLVLQIGLDMPVPIPDLRLDEHGVHATLSFNRSGFTCSVPWSAVFALVGDDGRGMVWPESMPQEIAAEVEREARRVRPQTNGEISEVGTGEGARRKSHPPEPSRPAPVDPGASRSAAGLRAPKLAVIAGDGTGESLSHGERRSAPPHLRLVK